MIDLFIDMNIYPPVQNKIEKCIYQEFRGFAYGKDLTKAPEAVLLKIVFDMRDRCLRKEITFA